MLWLTLALACSKDDVTEVYGDATVPETLEVVPLVNALQVWVSPDDGAAVTLVCEGAGETHALTAPTGGEQELVLYGLLADTNYDCEIAGQPFTAQTEPLPYNIPEMVQSGDPDIAGAYTLFNHVIHGSDSEDQKLIIVDSQGRVRWFYLLPFKYAGDIDARYLGDGQVLYGGGYGAQPTIIDLSGEEVWQAPPAWSGGRHHHHTEPVEEGVMSLSTETTLVDPSDPDGDTFSGFRIEIVNDDGDEVWGYSSQALTEVLPARSDEDSYHANWVERIDGDYWVSLRNASAIIAVDEDGVFQWEMGPNSDFMLRYPDGSVAPDSEWFFGQHAPVVELPRMWVYDNGTNRSGGGEYSRVVEYEVDLEAQILTVVWSWTEEPWWDPIWGDVDRLESGRILITKAHCSNCSNARDGEHSALIEVDPETDEVLWRVDFSGNTDGLYRAERVDHCAVFNNQTLCSD